MDKGDQRPSAAFLDLINGFRVSQAIHVAATLGIADLLRDGPRSSDELAAATGTHAGALYRLLRTLAGVGVFREDVDRRFGLTPLGECLRSDAHEPLGPWAVHIGQPYVWQAWGHLLESVRTGENAFRRVHGVSVWDYYARNPTAGAIFDRAMTGHSRLQADAVLKAYDFGRFGCVLDVGGGHGLLLSAVLAKHPSLRGVLFDQPHVVVGAEPVLQAAGVADRCQVVGGDFFEALPDGSDAHVMKFILHDWEDAQATAILRTCRRAIAPNGKLLVIDSEISPPNEGALGKLRDLTMLVHTGGRERTREEWTALFAAGGFRLVRATPTEAGLSIIEGVPT
ncbi:MAG TPA: methyltransferase [bacterium]|nr:methyltransferase [bacterium]